MAADTKTEVGEAISSYLKKPYARLVVPEDDGTFRGEVLEFPGCIAIGDTPAEAFASLEEAAKGWLRAALIRNQNIPEPVENTEFSGRLVLRLPKSLHKKAARFAEYDGVSLNQFIIASIAECVGERARSLGQVTLNAAFTMMKTGIFIEDGRHSFVPFTPPVPLSSTTMPALFWKRG